MERKEKEMEKSEKNEREREKSSHKQQPPLKPHIHKWVA